LTPKEHTGRKKKGTHRESGAKLSTDSRREATRRGKDPS